MRNHSKSKIKCKLDKSKDIKKKLSQKKKKFCRLSIKKIHNPVLYSIEEYNKQQGKHLNIFTNKEVLKRITINTIRHEFTNYDKVIKSLDIDLDNSLEFKKYTNKKIYKKYGNEFINNEITELRITCLISL